MKKLVILGSGTGGTIIAAKMRQKLLESKWEITIIDRDWQHHYQPGWLFIPFGIYSAEDCVKPKVKYIPPGVNFVLDEVTGIDPEKREVKTKRDTYAYDWLVVATGCGIAPHEVEGMSAGMGKDIHNFYSRDGAVALCIFQMDADPNRVFAVAISESEAAYRTYSESKESQQRNAEMSKWPQGEPKWHGGRVLEYQVFAG